MVFLLFILSAFTLPTLIIKEQTNIDYFARRDFEYMEIFMKNGKTYSLKASKLGWTVDIYSSSVQDVVNTGIDPGIRTITSNSIYWTFTHTFYMNITFSFIYQMGALPLSGTGSIRLYCNNSTYTMYIINEKIVPSLVCQWSYQNLEVDSGIATEVVKKRILSAFADDSAKTFETLYTSLFTTKLGGWYFGEYNDDKNTFVAYDDLNTKVIYTFQFRNMRANVAENSIDFTYAILMRSAYNYRTTKKSELMTPKDASIELNEYSRMYVIAKDIITNTANIILPIATPYIILPNDIPKDSYWELELWNFQKVLPDVLLLHENSEKDDLHIAALYQSDSQLKLTSLNVFGDYYHYRLSGLRYVVNFIQQDMNPLLNCEIELYVDLFPSITVESETIMALNFRAGGGGSRVISSTDTSYGGFINNRGLEEFINEGLNDYLIKQLGHKVFGNGMKFIDHSKNKGIVEVMPQEDGIYITLK